MFTFLIQRTQLNYLGAWNRLSLIRQKLCHHYQVKAKTKKSPVAFRIRIFLFRPYSFGIETLNTSIHVRSRSSREKHTRFQTKMGKVFSDQKRYPLGGTYLYGLYKGLPPGPDPFQRQRPGLKMSEENSILIRLMIQRTGRHNSTKNLWSIYNFKSRVLLFTDLLILFFLP